MWACVCINFFQSLNWSKLKLDLPINVAALYIANKFFACSWFKSTGFKMTDLASWSCSILIHKKDGNWTFQLFEASEVIITKFDSQALHIKEFIWRKVDGRSTTYLFFLSSWTWTFYCINDTYTLYLYLIQQKSLICFLNSKNVFLKIARFFW